MKKIILALGLAVTLQPAPAVAMDSVTDVATNKWVIFGACGLLGYGFQKYVGDWLKSNVFTEKPLPLFNENDAIVVAAAHSRAAGEKAVTLTEANRRIAEAAKIGKRNKDDGELPDDTTSNLLNFASDLTNLNGVSGLGLHALVNAFNFYRSVDTVTSGFAQWLETLDGQKALMTSIYAVAAAAAVIIPQKFAKGDVAAQAASRFISRSYLRSKLLQWLSDEEKDHKFNKNLSDIVDMILSAYYKA